MVNLLASYISIVYITNRQRTGISAVFGCITLLQSTNALRDPIQMTEVNFRTVFNDFSALKILTCSSVVYSRLTRI